jgi:hypothetical protein
MSKLEHGTGEHSGGSHCSEFSIGDMVTIKAGASQWMKQRDFWLPDWPDSIDGMEMQIVADYTHLGGESSHWWVENDTVKDCGVHPQFLLSNVRDQGQLPQ